MAGACADVPEPTVNIEIYSWWRSSGEYDAQVALVQPFKGRHPEVTIPIPELHETAQDWEHSNSVLVQRILLGTPPNTFLANAGADLLRWVAVEHQSTAPLGSAGAAAFVEGDTASLLTPFQRLPDDIYDEVSNAVCARVNGSDGFYGVPVNVHRLNNLYYNIEQTEALGAPGQVFSAESLCPGPGNPQQPPYTIAMSAGFPLSHFVFENLTLSQTDHLFYESLFRGEPTPGWRLKLRAVLECLRYMSQSFVSASDWVDAVQKVVRGEATMTVMGDWANPEFHSALLKLAEDTAQGATGGGADSVPDELEVPAVHERIGRIPFPGTEAFFVFASDTFPHPARASFASETEQLLSSFLVPSTQVNFSVNKGSIPALRGALLAAEPQLSAGRPPVFPVEWMTQARDDFEGKLKVLATSGWLPSYFSQPRLREELSRVVQADEADLPSAYTELLDFMESNLPLLRHWQATLQPCE